MPKPIIVICDNKIKQTDSLWLADMFTRIFGGTIYRREDWYQEKCKQVELLIKELEK